MNPGLAMFKNAQRFQEGGNDVPAPAGAGDLVKPPNLPYIQGPGLFGSNNWPWWARYGVGVIPYAGAAFNAARTGYNIFDRIRWAMTQPNTGGTGGTGSTGGTGGDGTTDDSSGYYGLSQFGGKKQDTGVGIDPMGNPAKPGEWWSNDFGRWDTDKYGTSPGNYWNQGGPGGPPGTKGLGGNFGIGGSGSPIVPGSYVAGNLGGDAVVNAGDLGGGGVARGLMMKLAKGLDYGIGQSNPAAPPPFAFSQAFLKQYPMTGSGTGQPGAIVNPAALGGIATTQTSQHFRPKAEAQMGTSDLNPGHRIFKSMQGLRKPKRKNQP